MLFTHKNEIIYLERARIYTEDDRIIYAQDREVNPYRYNIPYLNTQMLILGHGTSITHSAIEKLREGNVVLVTSGAKGMPFIMLGNTHYSKNEYAQGYLKQWFIEENQLKMAKHLFFKRISFNKKFYIEHIDILDKYIEKSKNADSISQLMGIEGDFVKNFIYRLCAKTYNINSFNRNHDAKSREQSDSQKVNTMLNHGNNLIYGLSAGVLWTLGIPAQFPLIHGQTRNSGLIFDVADLIKDSIATIWAFENYNTPMTNAMHNLRDRLKDNKADIYMFESLKELASGEF